MSVHCLEQVTYREMMSIIETQYPDSLFRCPDPKEEVAKNYQIDGFVGSVSFVTSMTDAFCGDCNRWVVSKA